MRVTTILSAALLGLFTAFSHPGTADAQGLRVLEGATSATLRVPLNRAVVVESETLFAELSVANPAIADIATLSERSIYVLGRSPGRTTMTLLSAEGSLIANVEIQVVPDVAELRERLREILPGEPIEVRTANDGIVLSGTVGSAQAVERAMQLAERYAPGSVSNLMLVGGTQQVMLQVRFAEMQRSVRQELSTSLGISGGEGNFGVTIGTGTTGTGPSTFGGSNLLVGDAGERAGGLGVSFGAGSLQLSVLLEALESNGLVRTLAEPNLSALSGSTATFLAGGEYAIPTESESGGTTVEFKPFGINLSFIPTVVDGDIINLELIAEISSIGEIIEGTDIPSLNTRRAATTVEMRDGESFAIAGLLQDDFRSSLGEVPWLSDLPVLGTLFRSSSYQRAQSELVIIISAHLVTPVRGEALTLPTDLVQIPTENELFFQGRVEGRGTAAGDVAAQDFTGSYGYVMD
ncbi:type II and III secretion system protein family protein [Roseibacterium beibuensis]|uniref:Type II and III secretion system protein family protein n=1 Tax=[Roseibacterium] beibuensis TaxID=1193142 RepID=A0ABP9KV47_9RHOB|nr:type II and III secretion system protein family protein [Roseibacterium beibuensis]MCS6622288.1 type II and III secretion system protein family protein [Roseibacterium beibuensis]